MKGIYKTAKAQGIEINHIVAIGLNRVELIKSEIGMYTVIPLTDSDRLSEYETCIDFITLATFNPDTQIAYLHNFFN